MKTLPYRPLILLLMLLLLISMTAAVVVGPSDIQVGDTVQALLNLISADRLQGVIVELQNWKQTVVCQVRLPRVMTAALVGASLALCGAVLQGVFRNPLASPSILGVSSGASLGAVIAIFLALDATTIWALPGFAFIGAGITLLLVYRIATYRGHTPIGTLLLSGVAVSAFNVSLSSLVLALALQNWEVGKSIVYWTMGGLDGRNWYHVSLLLPVFTLSILVIINHQKDLDILMIGEIHANAVGVDVSRVRLILLLVTALLTGCVVSVAGGIGFLGLVVPHITRLLVGPQHQRLLPVSALLGAVILVTADLIIRGDASYATIPLGVVTATMGAPFFLFLLLKQRKIMQV